jgi:hypothetical protein
MFKRRLFLGVLAVATFCCLAPGCKKETTSGFESKLISAITAKCQSQVPCTLRIKDVTDFEWDKLYVFKYTASREVVEKVIGNPLKSYNEFHRRIVFTDNGHIAFYEEEPTNIEHVINNEVIFGIPDSTDYRAYDADSVFTVQKVSTSNSSYYQLRKVR